MPTLASKSTPLDPIELSKRFSKEVWEEFGNTTSQELLDLWALIFEAFNETHLQNIDKDSNPPQRIVVPASTGSGKTQCFRFYAAEIAKHTNIGILIITKFKSEINDAVNDINTIVERPAAAGYYSGSYYQDAHIEDQLNQMQVVVITHEYFVRNHHSRSLNHSNYKKVMTFNDCDRSIIIVDESINLINNIKIDRGTLEAIETRVSKLVSKDGYTELKQELELIRYLEANIDSLFFDKTDTNKTYIHIESKDYLLDRLSSELNTSKDSVISLFKLDNCINVITNLIATNIDILFDSVNKKKLIDFALNIRLLLDDGLYLYQGKEYRISTFELPNKSLSVLDATANVNDIYKNLANTVVLNTPTIKTYQDVTLRFQKVKYGLGGNDLKKNKALHLSNMGKLVNSVSEDFGDDTVIFTHKLLEECMPYEYGHKDHFGNLTGVNKYASFQHVIIYGILYKPQFIHIDSLYHSIGDHAFLDKMNESITQLGYSDISVDLIQMINRGKCRNIINGKAPKMTIYLLLPNNKELNKRILSEIEKEMVGINIINLDVELESVKNKETKRPTDKDIVFINCMNLEEQSLKVSNLFKLANMSPKQNERARRHLTKPEYENSFLSRKISEIGYKVIKDGQLYLKKNTP